MAKLADVNMKCHLTASSRVYVGALPEDVEVDELHDLMKEFGTVRGIRINGKYGFVQFDNEASAQAAINHKRVTCRGRTLILKIAVYRNNNAGGDGDGGEREPRNLEPRPFRDRSPMMHPPRGNYGGDWGENRYGGRPGERGDPYMGEGYPRDVGPYRGLPNSVPEKNDCEIIVVSKALTQYAEFIEGRLKRLGLVVDLLFPNEDVPIGRVLGNISSRGCLYAILVMPQNLEHNSLTLNILHGLPQEHRNMPIDDSMELISHNWAEYQSSGRVAGRAALMGHLRRLAAGNTLTVLQYDTVLQYLKDARVRQVKLELGEQAVDNSNKTQVDLQQRIMSILDGGDATASPAPQATPVPPPVLSNPVQMALDSLLNKITSN